MRIAPRKRIPVLIFLLLLLVLTDGPVADGRVDGVPGSRAMQPATLFASGFEAGMNGWQAFYARDPATARVDRVADAAHGHAVRITSLGEPDWALDAAEPIAVRPGDVLEWSGLVRREDAEADSWMTLALTLWDADGGVIDWNAGAREIPAASGAVGAQPEWVRISTRIAIPVGGVAVTPRISGGGPSGVMLDDATLVRTDYLSVEPIADELTLQRDALTLRFRSASQTISVEDRRTGIVWNQEPMASVPLLLSARIAGDALHLRLYLAQDDLTMEAEYAFGSAAGGTSVAGETNDANGTSVAGETNDANGTSVAGETNDANGTSFAGNMNNSPTAPPEITFTLHADGPLSETLQYPPPFRTEAGTRLIVPLNEGIGFDVADPAIDEMWLPTNYGHGLCMPFLAVEDGAAALLTIVGTPSDARLDLTRGEDGLMRAVPVWEPILDRFGESRSLRWQFLEDGGFVAACRQYRREAERSGLAVTLAQKAKANPAIERLIGAANLWSWEPWDSLPQDLADAGIDRALISCADLNPAVIQPAKALGMLTGKYDIYQDVLDPTQYPDYTPQVQDAWPDDLLRDERGNAVNGWDIWNEDGSVTWTSILCDLRAPFYARAAFAADPLGDALDARFLDTTAAASLHECRDTDHPMTRAQSLAARKELLALSSRAYGWVTGAERGIDAVLPVVAYFEGMTSLGPYQEDTAGHEPQKIFYEVPSQIPAMQLNPRYRLPLWELVYHDCVVSYPYWGDHNNKFPAVWERKDQFCALYGTPPMYFVDRAFWKANTERFRESFAVVGPPARATGMARMTNFEWLTDDRLVQRTTFANGVQVTANFGETAVRMEDGSLLDAGGVRMK